MLLLLKREIQSYGLDCYDKKMVCWQNKTSSEVIRTDGNIIPATEVIRATEEVPTLL